MFTTRPDTLFGATFMVLAPEHPLVSQLTAPDRVAEVDAYVAQAAIRTEIDRLSTDREKTGVALGADAINPVNSERIPIYIADYVLGGYGTGAIMAVPAHDERDYAFAVTYGLPIRRVVASRTEDADAPMDEAFIPHTGGEVLVNSGPYTGLPADEGGKAILDELETRGKGTAAVTYRLHDWLISRQRYWGTPIPVIYCEKDGIVPVPEEDLPVRLPDTVDYRGSGENPLNRDEAFLNVTCPVCSGPAKRETDTMDTFIDSSWYWYRYLSPEKAGGPIDHALVDTWTPVDQYTGGAEHAVMHLLYAREWTKMMRDVGLVDQDEPFKRLFNQGQILGLDGERMSKSRGNTVDPDDLVARYGADTVRLFLMFMGPWDQGGPWSPTGIGGVHRFLNRVWTLAIDEHGREPGDPDSGSLPAGESEADAQAAIRAAAHRTLRDVTADYEAFHFNTMIAKLMELSNTLFRYRGTVVAGTPAWDEAIRLLLLMLAPAAPHITEELWSRRLEGAGQPWVSIHTQTWPEVDPSAVTESTREIPVQVNGKLRDKVVVSGRRVRSRHRGGRPRPRQDQGDPRRARPGPHRRCRRREARQPRRSVTSDDALAFDRHLDATAPAVADIARALRLTVLEGFPDAVETFDPADGLLAIGTGRSMRAFSFAIIPHKAHVNLQLADGVDLPNPDGHIEGTGKRVRHVKVRSVEDARAPWVRAAIAAQLAYRAG